MGLFQTSKKEVKREQEELNNDVQEFNKELRELLRKYKLAMIPVIQSNKNGIIPGIEMFRHVEEQK